jgi:hypothetical protein
MATDVEIDRCLAALTATVNDQGMDQLDTDRVQEILDGALDEEPKLTVDSGGGIHDEDNARIAALRRSPSGEWIVDRQNPEAQASDTAVPKPPALRGLRKLLTRLKVRG